MRAVMGSIFTAGLLSLFALPAMAEDESSESETMEQQRSGELSLPGEASEQGHESSAEGLERATEAREKREEFGRDRARDARERRPDVPARDGGDRPGGGRP